MSIEEFLCWDSGDDLRYELVEGWPVAQSAPTRSHGRMDVNVGASLKQGLKYAARPCVVESGSALRIDKRWTVRAPDLLVRCGPDRRTADMPLLAVEILSPSNSASEMARKRDDYASVGIQQVLELDQDEARALLWRVDGDRWIVETIRGLEASVTLDSIGVTLPMAEIYEDVELTLPADGPPPAAASAP
ncbi:hypothetical protein IP70_20890 [alpha proteobacterium AAP38]|nr:hypothetical protein IP70_20890 [alpha proteobacterium AAP38]